MSFAGPTASSTEARHVERVRSHRKARFRHRGSSGLGRHFAGVLAAAGAVVSLGARRAEALAETVRDVGAERAHGLVMDVTDPLSVGRAFDGAEARFGPVTVLVNNAGVTATRAAISAWKSTGVTQVMRLRIFSGWSAA
jgi:NAD(P)-dependent dehydrogenase (short-subunit alcohol dehydrogenase family)